MNKKLLIDELKKILRARTVKKYDELKIYPENG